MAKGRRQDWRSLLLGRRGWAMSGGRKREACVSQTEDGWWTAGARSMAERGKGWALPPPPAPALKTLGRRWGGQRYRSRGGGKGGLISCPMTFIGSVEEETRWLGLERGEGGVWMGRGGLRIERKVRKGPLMESQKEPVTQERAAE